MTELMKKIAKKQLWVVSGQYSSGDVGDYEEGMMVAAVDHNDAVEQVEKFWTEEQGWDKFTVSEAECIDEVGGFKVVLVEDEQA